MPEPVTGARAVVGGSAWAGLASSRVLSITRLSSVSPIMFGSARTQPGASHAPVGFDSGLRAATLASGGRAASGIFFCLHTAVLGVLAVGSLQLAMRFEWLQELQHEYGRRPQKTLSHSLPQSGASGAAGRGAGPRSVRIVGGRHAYHG